MTSFIKKNFYFLTALLPLGIFYFLFIFFNDFINSFWSNTTNKNVISYLGIGYLMISFIGYLFFQKEKIDIQKIPLLRRIILIFLTLPVIIWFYSPNQALNICYITIAILIFYIYRNKKKQKISIPMIFLFLFGILQFLGLLWNTQMPLKESFSAIQGSLFFITIPIISIYFKVTKKEKYIFTTTIFKFSLLLLILHIVSYLFLTANLGINRLSCFTFDKNYLQTVSYYDIMRFTKYVHPSFLSWLFLIIGGGSYITWKNQKKRYISTPEIILFFISLLFFIYIVQARVAQIGYFIVIGFLLFIELTKYISQKIILGIFSTFFIFFLIGIYYTREILARFNDPIRDKMINGAWQYMMKNPIFGTGSGTDIYVLNSLGLKVGYIHNDFITAFIRHGIIGLTILVSWIFVACWKSLKSKDYYLLTFFIPSLLVMMTDSIFNSQWILCMTSIFLLTYSPYQKKD